MGSFEDIDLAKIVVDDFYAQKLLDLFEEGKIPQPVATLKKNQIHIIYLPVGLRGEINQDVISALDSTLGKPIKRRVTHTNGPRRDLLPRRD